MTRSDAINRLISLLAFNSYEAIRAAEAVPSLKENTALTLKSNMEAAEALGISAKYQSRCALYNAPIHEFTAK